jgi:glycosyltransferase involved in cell wall biosynthesis
MSFKVSVITPSYNQGRFIERTINSIITQQFDGRLEYLVMDGGSQDQTVAILKRYDSDLQWVSEKDQGQAHAVNKGLARATGDIIGWVNSDDIYYPGAIAAACNVFETNGEVDVVYGDAHHIDESDGVIEPYPTEAWNFDRLLGTCYLCQPAVFFRRSVVDRFGPLNDNLQFCLDYEYWIRLALGGANFFWKRQLLAGSRLYPETKTLAFRIPAHDEILDMLHEQFGRVPDQWLYNYAHVFLEQKRVPRSRRLLFPLLVSAISFYASLRWNHGISIAMRKTTRRWTGAAISEIWHEKFKK